MLIADQLNSGTHLELVTEELQVIWFDVEDHLKQVISDGLVVETNIDSAGQSKLCLKFELYELYFWLELYEILLK